jgi:GNAT superfamily N-acetyltransferase
MAVMPQWWGGRDLRAMLPSIFFEHFRTTSFVAEREEELVGFLVGFLCPTHADEAYIHFAGVHPAWRRAGLARDLYGRFCELARADGRRSVRAVTSVVNRDSIAFHQRLGFVLLPGDLEIDGLPAIGEPGVPEGAIVRFELRLDDLAAPAAEAAPEATRAAAPEAAPAAAARHAEGRG